MKLLGLTCGRRHSSNEILLKEALVAGRAEGADISMIRLLDLDIKPCTGCITCVMGLGNGGPGECVIRDDWHFLHEHLLACNGLIVAAPVFVLGAHGIIKILADRFGPARDIAFRTIAKKVRAEKGLQKGKGVDERTFHHRVGGFISVGGAITKNWLSFGLPMMHLLTFPSAIKIVDQIEITGAGRFVNVVLEPQHIEKARRLGRHVAQAMLKPVEQIGWMGEQTGVCPVCHCNLLTVFTKNPVECPVCGIEGTLSMEGDAIKVHFSPGQIAMARGTFAGEMAHVEEILNNLKFFEQRPDKDEIEERAAAYKTPAFESFVIPPPDTVK
ncbi:MAG: flavodoxin family protein [Desulfatitalea sp.]|nr:flavodoxin family protein [Desulfatitalea sp.]NNK02736.1 flavodoxin family protein [Desulfatitalea sp.]